MEKIESRELSENVVKLIGDKWMLVTAVDKEKFNTMTASWGGLGYIWNKPVAFILIRPERYTFEFTEKTDFLTLSFFNEKYRKALKICGTVSGRNTGKVRDAGLTPLATTLGNITFKEAGLILECKKIYSDFFKPENFHDTDQFHKWYEEGGVHKMYIYEIVNVWKNE
ncbi:MAG: flavin reductase [Rikenellaceae bacterium]|nr:flavin reductase [Rikenellaceae bacterium]